MTQKEACHVHSTATASHAVLLGSCHRATSVFQQHARRRKRRGCESAIHTCVEESLLLRNDAWPPSGAPPLQWPAWRGTRSSNLFTAVTVILLGSPVAWS